MNTGAANAHNVDSVVKNARGASLEPDSDAGADIDRRFELLVATIRPKLRQLAFHFARNWADADDITQITLLKAFRYRDRVLRVERPEAYLKQILLRTYIDHVRPRAMQEYVTAELPDAGVQVTDERDWAVHQALAQVPPAQREVLLLRFYLDLPEPEIARSMGVSPGTVKSHVANVLGKLNLRDRTQAAILAYESGLVQPGQHDLR